MKTHRRAVEGILLLTAGLLALQSGADAQPAAHVPRIGIVYPGSAPAVPGGALDQFRQGLRDLGYVEGKNIALEVRYDEGQPALWTPRIAELVQLPADVIVAGTSATARTAQQATRTIPIVMAVSVDPVFLGLVASLARPGGNVTGLNLMSADLVGKRFALLKSAVPNLTRVALLVDTGSIRRELELSEHQEAARAAGIELLPLQIGTAEEFAGAAKTAAQWKAQAMIVTQSVLLAMRAHELAEIALASRLPTLFGSGDARFARAGGLMNYGASIPASWYRAATYVHRILQGAKPADLPVEQPTRFEFIVNQKTAEALGLKLPASLLLQADEVIR